MQPSCNLRMARARGINTDFHTVLALMISNGLVGLSGGLYAQYQGARMSIWDVVRSLSDLFAVIIGDVLFGKMCLKQKNCICLHTALRHCRSYPVLPCFKCCFMVEIPIRRPEIILCNCSSYLPFNPISESET